MASADLHSYETLYILKPALSDSDASVIHNKIDSVIGKFQGKVDNRDDWGVRELAYEVEGSKSGRYTILHYTGNSGVVEEIERHFKISDDVIRYMTIRLEGGYDYSKVRKQMKTAEEEQKKAREARRKNVKGKE